MISKGKTILVVDPDDCSRSSLGGIFAAEGLTVIEASGMDQMLVIASKQAVDLVTLELSIGVDNGLTAIRRLRAVSKVPLMIVTDRTDTLDMVLALEVGADDYIAKPFKPLELIARMNALLRRAEDSVQSPARSGPDRVAFDDWVLDTVRRELCRRDGAPRDLTGAEYDLLSIFVKAPNRILTRDQIMTQLHGRSWSPCDRTVDMRVRRLRQKIEANPSQPRLIRTVRSGGYLFSSAVVPCT